MTTANETAGPSSGVLVGDDGSSRALDAIAYAAAEAARRGTTLRVVRAWTIPNAVRPAGVPTSVVPSLGEFEEATAQRTRERVKPIAQQYGVPVEIAVPKGSPGKVLLEAARDADVVVVGDRGVGGIAGRFIGSVADLVVREADCPVIVVRNRRA